MDKKTEYFVRKIERAINDGNYTEAKIYYDKAILYLGQIPEVVSYKSTIDSEIKRTKPNKQDSEDVSGIRKRKPINEALIILPIMALVIIGYLIYFFTNTYPMHHITKELSGTWYQGDLSSSSSKGVYLEFKNSIDSKYEIWYRTSSGHLVAKLECEIVNGKEIIVDGYPIKVEFDGDYVTFSPSFVDTSEESVWRNYREYTSSDKTGNFSKDDTLNSSDLSHTDSSTNSNSTTSDNADPCVNGHDWEDMLETVHHDEVGHYENVLVGYDSIEKYHCSSSDCNDSPWFSSYDELSKHYQTVHGYTVSLDQLKSMCDTSYDQKPVYENQWIIDTEAYEEMIVTGQKCKRCGATK